MLVNQRNAEIKGRIHVVRLNQKEIKVRLRYQSPTKGLAERQNIQISIKRINTAANNHKVRNLRSKRPTQPKQNRLMNYFYRLNVQEGSHLRDQYQLFHKTFNEINKYKCKIKVVSKSKENKSKESLIEQSNIKQFRSMNEQYGAYQHKIYIPLRKIVLYSPQRRKDYMGSRGKLVQTFNTSLKPQDRSNDKENSRHSRILLTTPQKRKSKIEVTSSHKRKKKADSFAIENDSSSRELKIQKLVNNLRESNNQLKPSSDSVIEHQ